MARTAVTVYPMKGGCTVTGSHLCCHCVKKGNSSAQDFAASAKSWAELLQKPCRNEKKMLDFYYYCVTINLHGDIAKLG